MAEFCFYPGSHETKSSRRIQMNAMYNVAVDARYEHNKIMSIPPWVLSRRQFLRLSCAAALMSRLSPVPAQSGVRTREFELTAKRANVRFAGEGLPPTEIWGFNGESPGPALRVKHGEALRVEVNNTLEEGITVHWHGLRIPNAMDGVPHITQPAIATGEKFVYEFVPPDAGTYWYHSHANAAEQVGRGLYGPLVIEEKEPLKVDRDETWVLDDWRLDRDAQIVVDFHRSRDHARAGRLGNTVTVNGKAPEAIRVRAGERIRLRLINAANARVFGLRFQGHKPWVIARDGQPVEPYESPSMTVIAPAQRVDLLLDMIHEPGQSFGVVDTYYPQSPYMLIKILYSNEPAVRDAPPDWPISLPANRMPEPDPSDAARLDMILAGGDLGRLEKAKLGGLEFDYIHLALLGHMWAINGVVASSYMDAPVYRVKLGQTVMLRFKNESTWPHPMHLHGHHFKVLSHNGSPDLVGKWLDTVLLGPAEIATVAFVADNPGQWLMHCHILEHHVAGMVAIIAVD